MKTLFSIIILLSFLSINLYAQDFNPLSNQRESAIKRVKAIEAYNAQNRVLSNQQVLDSMLFIPLNGPNNAWIQKFFYDEFGRDTLHIYYLSPDSNSSGRYSFVRNMFNSKNLLYSQINTSYYSKNPSKIWKDKNTFTYNSKNLIIEDRHYVWDSKFNLKSNRVYSRNINGDLTSVIRYTYNLDNNTGRPQYKDEYIFNNQNLETSHTYLDWNIVQWAWQNHWKSVTSYNSISEVDSTIELSWNGNNTQWDTMGVVRYTYDIHGNREKSTHIYYTPNKHISFILNYCYNTNNQLTGYLTNAYDSLAQQFTDTYKVNSKWNNQGDIINQLNYHKNQNTNQWDSLERMDYYYNSNFLTNNIVYPYSFNYIKLSSHLSLNHKPNYMLLNVNRYFFDSTSNNWQNWDNVSYYYSSKNVNSINIVSNKQVRCYPNPTQDKIYFDIPPSILNPQIYIYDITGKLVLEAVLPTNHQLSTKHLESGVYIFKITSNNHIYSGKFIVE